MLVKYLDVRFVYEELDPGMQPPPTKARQEGLITPADLQALPPEILSELQAATITADMTQILNVIEQISLHNPLAAEQLSGLANDFEYKKILNLIENSGGDA